MFSGSTDINYIMVHMSFDIILVKTTVLRSRMEEKITCLI